MDVEHDVFEMIKAGFEEMSREEIVLAPWLVMNKSERLRNGLKRQLKSAARDFAVAYGKSQILWLKNRELRPEFIERAYYETLLSTAAYLSYLRLGTLVITDEMVLVSNSLVRTYLADNGGSVLLSVYARVIMYLNGQVLQYYQRVPRDVFVSGAWHRPWIDYSIENELETGIQSGLFDTVEEKGKSFVKLTEIGEELYVSCRSDLERCGYIRQREQLIRASNFTSMDAYERIMDNFDQKIHAVRSSLIEWSDIHNGMQVLELGCGAGGLTLNGGLYRAVGDGGSVVATDPSVGMLARAKEKLSDYHAGNVTFRQAAAEEIPYSDNTFDAVIGMLFLHFTDIQKAFAEIQRVTRPGGMFTTLYPLELPRNQDFFLEWFQPVFARGLQAGSATSVFPDYDFVARVAGQYFTEYDCHDFENWEFDFSHVEDVVTFAVQASTVAELNDLPWQARYELFEELIERGYSVKEKFGAENMKVIQPAQWFKGTVKK